jgi:hypothetical protein
VLWELAVGHVLLFLQVRTFHVLWELAVGHVLLCLTFHVLLELAVGKEFFFLLCFSVNVECTGQDLRRALGIGGRPRALVLTGQDLPRAFGIGGRSRALVLFCKCRA